jgi:hypothetical protein
MKIAGTGLVASYFADVLSPSLLQARTVAPNVSLRKTAKNAIFIFLAGAASNTDMWDLKEGAWTPATFAPTDFNGGTIRFPQGLMPETSKHLDRMSFVRPGLAWAAVHQLGQDWAQIARNPSGATGAIAPHIGAVVSLESQVSRTPSDILPVFAANKDVTVATTDPLGNMGVLRFNHLLPPFDNLKMREAVLNLIDQKDYMRAVAGDEKYWKMCGAIFICGGTPFETAAGADVLLKGPNIEKAKALIKEAGYKGERIVLLSATDQSIVHNQALVTKERLRERLTQVRDSGCRRAAWSRRACLVRPFRRLAHSLVHCDFIPKVVHVSVWVQNLGTIAPKLALWWTRKAHADACQFLVLAVHVVHLNCERDFLSC